MKNKENELRTWGGKVVMALVLVMTLVGGLSAQEIDLLVKAPVFQLILLQGNKQMPSHSKPG